MNQAEQLHKESIVIDGTCPLLFERKHLADYRRGGPERGGADHQYNPRP